MPAAQFGPFLPGGVFLNGVQFSTDPEPYEPLNWPRRHSVHMTIGGGVTIQDFGLVQRDDTLKLGSGSERFLDEAVMLQLYALYQTRGTVYTLTDWLGNSFTVFIKDFRVWPFKRGAGRGGAGVISLWRYTMDLHVLTIGQLVGQTYTGA